MARTRGPLITVHQTCGRLLWCYKFVAAYTYDGWMIRTASESVNERMLTKVEREALTIFGKWPMHTIHPARPPGEIDYPHVRFTGLFTSGPMYEEMHLSSLLITWFQEELQPIPDDAGRVALQSVDWAKLAVDYKT